MAGSIIIKPAVQQRFDSFIQRGRVLFVSAPCGFGKSTLADALLEGRSVLRLSAGVPDFSLDALPEAWDILLIDDFQQIPEGSEEQTLCQLKLSGVSVQQDGVLEVSPSNRFSISFGFRLVSHGAGLNVNTGAW